MPTDQEIDALSVLAGLAENMVADKDSDMAMRLKAEAAKEAKAAKEARAAKQVAKTAAAIVNMTNENTSQEEKEAAKIAKAALKDASIKAKKVASEANVASKLSAPRQKVVHSAATVSSRSLSMSSIDHSVPRTYAQAQQHIAEWQPRAQSAPSATTHSYVSSRAWMSSVTPEDRYFVRDCIRKAFLRQLLDAKQCKTMTTQGFSEDALRLLDMAAGMQEEFNLRTAPTRLDYFKRGIQFNKLLADCCAGPTAAPISAVSSNTGISGGGAWGVAMKGVPSIDSVLHFATPAPAPASALALARAPATATAAAAAAAIGLARDPAAAPASSVGGEAARPDLQPHSLPPLSPLKDGSSGSGSGSGSSRKRSRSDESGGDMSVEAAASSVSTAAVDLSECEDKERERLGADADADGGAGDGGSLSAMEEGEGDEGGDDEGSVSVSVAGTEGEREGEATSPTMRGAAEGGREEENDPISCAV